MTPTRRSNKLLFEMTVICVAVVFTATPMGGCFSTYRFTPDEFGKLSTLEGDIPRTVVSKEDEEVLVERETSVYVRSVGGRRYQLTPFNFKMTRGGQLVASDRDTLLSLDEIEEFEVDHLNTPITVVLISVGVLIAGGLIAYTLVTAE